MAFKMKGFPLRNVETRQDKTRVKPTLSELSMEDPTWVDLEDPYQSSKRVEALSDDAVYGDALIQDRGDRLQATGRTLSGAGERSKAGQDFDRAFAQARKEGVETFMWRGEEYNTKLAGLE